MSSASTTASSTTLEPTRRDFLYIATGAVAAVGAASVAWPLISQMNPDAAVLEAGAPTTIDISSVAEGGILTVLWRGSPWFIRHRSKKEIDEAVNAPFNELKDPQLDSDRVKPGKAQWLVISGVCTHLGCTPIGHKGPYDGWYCPCHGSIYDTSGRIRSGPAPKNLPVPTYAFLSDTKIQLG
ncbi:ubiquinol-cytochrome c reductase iron-sulfur subunit [Methylovirgula sp. 4M-Z18]|uniref:ubiquinol-cytochrome c reductase iron-sulfur subunit n=1 Tax=Methylovirgula sp. 4M-Z18 TaxID=2293567 RepID=UPI000E2ED75A|nr:ubiquinol-cytochrome c reductase iron-sulfur subunit [Methylovirgula sp. 4M-Z18]RFB81384.1 ubiquinol-cytochrome c reductase iron-sulfur subunit [Methylovirgula sp. 4M-Z18]